MAKWHCAIEHVAIVEADTEQQAKEEFARVYRYFPQVATRVDDDRHATLVWRDRSFTVDTATGTITWTDPVVGIMEGHR